MTSLFIFFPSLENNGDQEQIRCLLISSCKENSPLQEKGLPAQTSFPGSVVFQRSSLRKSVNCPPGNMQAPDACLNCFALSLASQVLDLFILIPHPLRPLTLPLTGAGK